MLIDTHAHLNFNAYKDDGSEVIRRALDKDIWLINVGSQFDTSKRAFELAKKYPEGVYAAIGLHPIHLSETEVDEEEIKFKSREEKFDENKYQELIDDDRYNKIVAIGEIGLDYWHEPSLLAKQTVNSWKQKQKQGFLKQLNFAAKNNLPVVLHARGSKENPEDAYQDILDILSGRDAINRVSTNANKFFGVIHCFGSSKEMAQRFLDLGFYLGFTGIITYKNAESVREVVAQISLEKILVETDCPYLAPEPHRGERNEPAYVAYVAKNIAAIKNISYQTVADMTTQNVKRLFGIDDL